MKLKLLITALLVSAVAAAAPIISKPPAGKSPLEREWMILSTTRSGLIIGVDPKSFKVIKAGDLFSFDAITIFGKDSAINPPGLPPVSAHVTTVKASCSKKQAQIIADTLHDEAGNIVGTNEAAKIDKMDAINLDSIVGKVIEKVCAGQPLVPKAPEKQYERGDSIKNA